MPAMRRKQRRVIHSGGRRGRLLPLWRFVAQRLAVLQDLRDRSRPCLNVADFYPSRGAAGARRESFRSRRISGNRQSDLQTLWGGREAFFALLRNLRQYARPLERSPPEGTGRRRTGSRHDYWKAGRAAGGRRFQNTGGFTDGQLAGVSLDSQPAYA